jgi:predicted anti-sigma-YlaC factor YlaD
MLAKLRPRSAYDVMAALALFVALSTGGAYAANTVFSTDIVDGEVKTPDLANAGVTNGKLAPTPSPQARLPTTTSPPPTSPTPAASARPRSAGLAVPTSPTTP